jgi:hypothetical protein
MQYGTIVCCMHYRYYFVLADNVAHRSMESIDRCRSTASSREVLDPVLQVETGEQSHLMLLSVSSRSPDPQIIRTARKMIPRSHRTGKRRLGTLSALVVIATMILVVSISPPRADAFYVVPTCPTIAFRAKRMITTNAATVLYYKDNTNNSEEEGEEGELQPQQQQPSSLSQQQRPRSALPSLPVLGPFWKQPPLLPAGQEWILRDPTPMQWQTLEQCVRQHAALLLLLQA